MKETFRRILIVLALLLCSISMAAGSSRHHHRYYRNSSGHRVHTPVHARTAPTGASAICNDGTYSFSQNHRGTCSHHGGVRSWLR